MSFVLGYANVQPHLRLAEPLEEFLVFDGDAVRSSNESNSLDRSLRPERVHAVPWWKTCHRLKTNAQKQISRGNDEVDTPLTHHHSQVLHAIPYLIKNLGEARVIPFPSYRPATVTARLLACSPHHTGEAEPALNNSSFYLGIRLWRRTNEAC